MPDMQTNRTMNGLRIGLTGCALVMVACYAFQRQTAIHRQSAEAALTPPASHGPVLTPQEFMARMEGRVYLIRDLGKLRYPASDIHVDTDQPASFHAVAGDRPAIVAAYYANACGLQLEKSTENGEVKYSGSARVKQRSIQIVIAPEGVSTIITYLLPDMVLPKHP